MLDSAESWTTATRLLPACATANPHNPEADRRAAMDASAAERGVYVCEKGARVAIASRLSAMQPVAFTV